METGYYWVKWDADDEWEPALFDECWELIGLEEEFTDGPDVIGPKIEPPGCGV
jgi:hypothetical protein